MIDWIDEAGRSWGVSKRRILLGGYRRDDGSFHQDGFSARSAVGKLFEGRGELNQRFPEVFTGDALAFEVAMEGVSEPWYYLAHYKYIIPARMMQTKTKILELREIFPRRFRDERSYYNELHGLHCYLLGRMPDTERLSA